jgi:hypothetical protein
MLHVSCCHIVHSAAAAVDLLLVLRSARSCWSTVLKETRCTACNMQTPWMVLERRKWTTTKVVD